MKQVKRKKPEIEEDLCDGGGICNPPRPEQAIPIVAPHEGKKARLVEEFYCPRLVYACLGSCPAGAITIEERGAKPNEKHLFWHALTEAQDKNQIEVRKIGE